MTGLAVEAPRKESASRTTFMSELKLRPPKILTIATREAVASGLVDDMPREAHRQGCLCYKDHSQEWLAV